MKLCQKQRNVVTLLLLLLLLVRTDAFAGSLQMAFLLGHTNNYNNNGRVSTTQRHALIFGGFTANGTLESDDKYTTIKSSPLLQPEGQEDIRGPSQQAIALLEQTLAVDFMSTLVRIACVHASPPHNNIQPFQVLHAQLVEVTSTHMNIALAISANGGTAAQVLTTVPYVGGQPLHESSNWQTALFQNVQHLDQVAQTKLALKQGWNELQGPVTSTELEFSYDALTQDVPKSERPGWWSPTVGKELMDECQALKDIFNQDDEFQQELTALWSRQYMLQTPFRQVPRVVKTSVATLGSVGMLLRARYEHEDEVDRRGRPILDTLVMGIPFDSKLVTSVDDLRTSVLDMVETALDQPLPPPVVPPPAVAVGITTALVAAQNEAVDTVIIVEETVAEDIEEDTAVLMAKKDETEVRVTELNKKTDELPVMMQQEAVLEGSVSPSHVIILDEDGADVMDDFETDLPRMAPRFVKARQQPKTPEEEARLAQKYAAIPSLGDRAFAILKNLGMI